MGRTAVMNEAVVNGVQALLFPLLRSNNATNAAEERLGAAGRVIWSLG